VKGGAIDHAHLVGKKLKTGCHQVHLVPQVVLISEAIVKEKPEEEDKTKQVSPDIHSLVVYLENTSQAAGVAKGLAIATGDPDLKIVDRCIFG